MFYITKVYALQRTKAKITCRELFEVILPKWGEYATRMREEGKDDYYYEKTDYNSE